MAAVAGRRCASRSRRGSPPGDETVVEGRPVLQLSAAAIEAFCDLYVDILVDALVRQERGADPVEAVRAALAAAETRMARC